MPEMTEDCTESLEHLRYIISNREYLKTIGQLESQWINRYVNATCFKGIPFKDLKGVFDACDRKKLWQAAEDQGQELPIRSYSHAGNPWTVFRGCVGSAFREGMSWTTDLYQAIKYPKRAKNFNWYGSDSGQPCSVWCALVEADEVYCIINQFEPEFIVCPKTYWRVDIPQSMFEY